MFKRLVFSTLLLSATQGYAQTPQDALITIATYAEDANTPPTLEDYHYANIADVGSHNLHAINAKVKALSFKDVDTQAEVQNLVDTYNKMIASVMGIVTSHILTPVDTDGDGIPDINDAFPNNAGETVDSDGDGIGNNADAFPNNAGETVDSDGDGIGDNADPYPNNEDRVDGDNDGIPDVIDPFPNEVGTPTDFSGLGTFDGPFGTKGLQGTITDPDGVASVRIDFSNGTYSSYSDGNINNESTHASGTSYTITVVDENGVVKTKTGTI